MALPVSKAPARRAYCSPIARSRSLHHTATTVVTVLLASLLLLIAGPPAPARPGGRHRGWLVVAVAAMPSGDDGPGAGGEPAPILPMDGDADAKGLKGNATVPATEAEAADVTAADEEAEQSDDEEEEDEEEAEAAEDEEDEDEEDEEEDDDDAAADSELFPRSSKSKAPKDGGRHVTAWRKQRLLARLLQRLNVTATGVLDLEGNKNATSDGSRRRRQLLLQATRALSTRRAAQVGVRLLVVAALAYAVSRAVSFKATMQFLMILSVLAEIAGRLGLLKDLRLPFPFLPSGSGGGLAAALRAQAKGPATFSFELLNDRYQGDMARLGLLIYGNGASSSSGSRVSPALVAAASAAASAAAANRPPVRPKGVDAGVRMPAYGQGPAPPVVEQAAAPPAAVVGNATEPTAAAAAAAAEGAPSPSSGNSSSNSTSVESPPAAPGANFTFAVKKPRCYVMTIKGDLMLTQGPYLAQAVSFLLEAARPGVDEVLLLLESGGGAAFEYGLGASQLERLRKANIRLTVSVDKVAASGGYMMACVADRLFAAPFATLGSIGATTSMPILNVKDFLARWGVRAYTVRSGKHKGGGSPVLVGDAKTDQAAIAKLQDDLARVHEQFKAHVKRWRGMVDVEAVGTGEVWQGREAQALGLVDDVLTSEEYIHRRTKTHDVIRVAPAPDVRRWFLNAARPGGGGGGAPPLPIGAAASTVGGMVVDAVVAACGGGGRRRRRGELVFGVEEGGGEEAAVTAGVGMVGRALSVLGRWLEGVGGGGGLLHLPVLC